MTEIIIHTTDKPKVSECLRTHELFEKDQIIIINDNYGDPHDKGGSLHACWLRKRRISRFLYEEFKNRQVEALSIDNETGSVSIVLFA